VLDDTVAARAEIGLIEIAASWRILPGAMIDDLLRLSAADLELDPGV
jgi:hypothetical protein